jgi:hypothetical protein
VYNILHFLLLLDALKLNHFPWQHRRYYKIVCINFHSALSAREDNILEHYNFHTKKNKLMQTNGIIKVFTDFLECIDYFFHSYLLWKKSSTHCCSLSFHVFSSFFFHFCWVLWALRFLFLFCIYVLWRFFSSSSASVKSITMQ